ncbi:pyridoxal-phosphate dependent enzyme [Metarhizium robertsii]|uniref:Pyridoxal-phosphate dependent enzyme n=1 Tax=Metarhizium robertsii TaxID=568076 RepID=A0A0A1V3V0_9HYPO|nr:pyridoxal-phosphate dependent enzyme [Metarhizium robertsii]
MTGINHLNVYSGPDSVRKYFDPECQPPLPLVEIPECLNPYRADGVRIYAKMMSMHPATNVKVMPAAMNLLEKGIDKGKTTTVVESSSGSTVISMAMVARAFHGINDVHAFLSNKTSETKLRLMQFFGLNVTLFGGPAQPTPVDERGGIRAASRKAAESESVCSPNQYQNDDLPWAHPVRLLRACHANVSSVVRPIVNTDQDGPGTMTGLGTYFKQAKPSVYRVAVCTNAGERVPGPREYSLMNEVKFPYRAAVDALEEVGAKESYSLSLDLTRQGIVCGPSSGFTLQGLFQRLEKKKQDGSLSQLAGSDGEINCVFICSDLPYQYLNEYFQNLGPEKFSPLKNERLRNVDLYRYDDAWERGALDALADFFAIQPTASNCTVLSLAAGGPRELGKHLAARPNTQVLDFRRAADFDAFHLPNSVNVPLETLRDGAARGSPFAHPVDDGTMLEELWLELEAIFTARDKDGKRNPGAEALMAILRNKKVLTICYDGDSARVANSVLRHKGIRADSISGGIAALSKVQLPNAGAAQQASHVVSVEA